MWLPSYHRSYGGRHYERFCCRRRRTCSCKSHFFLLPGIFQAFLRDLLPRSFYCLLPCRGFLRDLLQRGFCCSGVYVVWLPAGPSSLPFYMGPRAVSSWAFQFVEPIMGATLVDFTWKDLPVFIARLFMQCHLPRFSGVYERRQLVFDQRQIGADRAGEWWKLGCARRESSAVAVGHCFSVGPICVLEDHDTLNRNGNVFGVGRKCSTNAAESWVGRRKRVKEGVEVARLVSTPCTRSANARCYAGFAGSRL